MPPPARSPVSWPPRWAIRPYSELGRSVRWPVSSWSCFSPVLLCRLNRDPDDRNRPHGLAGISGCPETGKRFGDRLAETRGTVAVFTNRNAIMSPFPAARRQNGKYAWLRTVSGSCREGIGGVGRSCRQMVCPDCRAFLRISLSSREFLTVSRDGCRAGNFCLCRGGAAASGTVSSCVWE